MKIVGVHENIVDLLFHGFFRGEEKHQNNTHTHTHTHTHKKKKCFILCLCNF